MEAVFTIEQRINDPITNNSYRSIFTIIAQFLNVKLNISKHNGKLYFIVQCSSPAKLIPLINYLSDYQLFTSKRLNFEAFKTCHSII